MFLHMSFVILTHSDISVIFNLAWGQLVTNCLCSKKHKQQKGKRFSYKLGSSLVPTILIRIKNNNYKLNKQNSCNLIFIFFFFLRVSQKPVNLNLGRKNKFFSLFDRQSINNIFYAYIIQVNLKYLKNLILRVIANL